MREYTCRHKDKNGRDNDNRIRQKFHEKYRSKKNEEEKEIKNEVEKIMIVIIRDIREKKKNGEDWRFRTTDDDAVFF